MFNKLAKNKIVKKLPLVKMIYPAITLVFVVIILILFIKTLLFLSDNINKAFSGGELSAKQGVIKLDEENYQLIKKRFNLPEPQAPIVSPAASVPETIIPAAGASSTASTTVAVASTTAAVASTTAIETPRSISTANKSLISINILNSTKINGLAVKLKTRLIQAGYKIIKTGNLPVLLDNTTIQIKPSDKLSQAFIDEITKIVSEQYAPQPGTNLSNSDNYDILISIGSH